MPLVRIGTTLGYLLAYLAAVVLGRMAVLEGTGLALFWPAAGIAALWMLRATNKRMLAVDAALLVASSTLTFIVVGLGQAALVLGLANLVQGLVVRFLFAWRRRLPVTGPLLPGLASTRDLFDLGTASALAAVLSAPLGAAAALIMNDHVSLLTVFGWVVRNACGTFVVAAVVLTIMAAYRDRSQHRSVLSAEWRPYAGPELLAAVTASLCPAFFLFASSERLPIGFVMLAASVWIGFRFSPAVGALHSLGFGALALMCTLAGLGPFGTIEDLAERAIVVQFFVAVTVMIVLMLSLGVAERIALTKRLRQSEERASRRADLVNAVTTVMSDGLSVIDADGTVLLTNPAAERMAALPVGSPRVEDPAAHGVFHLDGSAPSPDDLPRARALRGETVPPMDLLRIDPHTGQQTILAVSAAPLHPGSPDEPAVAVIVMRDVTKVRAQRRELENFAGVVAHDLKNPLTGVISWAEILQEQLDEADLADGQSLHASVRRIRSSADRMAHLISDLLAYTQAQNAELSLQSVSLDAMVDQISRDLRETHHEEVPVVEHGPLGCVLADQTLVRQLLTNLIGNAVKYVAPGVIPHILIGSAAVDDMLEVWVHDNGIGITDLDLGRVFDSFFRASSTKDYPGTGLGLAICARTVERHGGRISARRGLGGEGTTMVFTLPLAPVPPRATSHQPDPTPVSVTS